MRPLVLTRGDELKLVFPQPGAMPERFAAPRLRALLPAADGRPANSAATPRLAIDYCLAHPQWRLSVQTHKTLGIP